MKKKLCILIVLSFCLFFVACGQNDAPAPDLYAAVEKLAAAESFRITISRNDATSTCQIVRNDGITRVLYEINSYVNANTPAVSTKYYEGNVCYSIHSITPEEQHKTIYKDGYQLTAIVCNDRLLGDVNGFLDVFLNSSPQYTQKDGMTIASLMLSHDDFIPLANKVFTFVDEDYWDLGKAKVSVSVDSAGYLREIDLKAGLLRTGPSITFTFDQINEIPALETPDFVKDFSTNIDANDPMQDMIFTYIDIIEGNLLTRYTNKSFFAADRDGWCFEGFSDYKEENGVIPVYEFPEQIDGRPLKSITLMYIPFSKITVERVVIPQGVRIQTAIEEGEGADNMVETVLFFCDAEENVEKNFGTWDEPHPLEDTYHYKAAYYAGEWEYVDGIPTALN